MSGSTIFLILKSLLPFLKEVFLEDKGLKDVLLANKPAALLACCLLFVFVLLVNVSAMASSAGDRIEELKKELENRQVTILENLDKIRDLEEIVRKPCTCTQVPSSKPTNSATTSHKPTKPPGKKTPKSSVRDRLRQFE